MKRLILLINLIACATLGNAQFIRTSTVTRNIKINFINRDSVNLSLNENFEMVEDSCAQIIRYGHLNMQERKFKGKVKDVSKGNPLLVLSEGFYTDNGLKDGPFITRFLSGNMQARGNFKNGEYDGKWEIFYDNNKPRVTFEGNGRNVKIIDMWDEKGNKIIDNGNGNYRGPPSDLFWKGKLANGKPDGTWKAINNSRGEETVMITENFKNGIFQKGSGTIAAYTDSSRIMLVAPDLLPFTQAEAMRISMTNCDGTSLFNIKKVVGAKYGNGFESFNTQIQNLMPDAFKDVDIRRLTFSELLFKGEIATSGRIVNFNAQSHQNDAFVRTLTRQLQKLPFLEPATVDGKPVKQNFTIAFIFNEGMYRFNYSLLPIEVR
ncbi:toxin-antitoxin system YwqK family antitoxin [Mucilaginibacter sp. HD30]